MLIPVLLLQERLSYHAYPRVDAPPSHTIVIKGLPLTLEEDSVGLRSVSSEARLQQNESLDLEPNGKSRLQAQRRSDFKAKGQW